MGIIQTEIFGRLLGIGADKQLVSNDIDITPVCVDCTITVGTETTNVIPITIQLKDAEGNDISYSEVVELLIFGDAGKLSAADGGSTGLAIGTDGAIISAPEAKKHLVVSSEADGDIDLTFTDTGTTAYYLGVKLPTGRIVMSDVIQMAA
jgi:hypothetical protein